MTVHPYAKQYQQNQQQTVATSEEAMALACDRCRQLTDQAKAAYEKGQLDLGSKAVAKVQDILMGLASLLDFQAEGRPPAQAEEIIKFSAAMASLYDWWCQRLTEALTGRVKLDANQHQDDRIQFRSLAHHERLERFDEVSNELTEFHQSWTEAAKQRRMKGGLVNG